jgi:hypothetical protein
MKKVFLLFVLLISANHIMSQDENNDKDLSIKLSGFINLNAICDFNGLDNYEDFTTSEIPINPTSYEKSMRLHWTARQSRVNLDTKYKTPVGIISGKISGDFYSGNQGDYSFFRLRLAYIQYKNLLIGQDNTTFGNPNVTPNTIDFEGPNSAPSLRNPMISYTNSFNKKWSYGLALEMRGTDFTTTDTTDLPFKSIPTLVGNINRSGNWGVVTLSGMMDVNRYFDNNDATKAAIGYGGALSVILNTNKLDHISLFAVGGKGIANFISDLSGSGYNGVLQTNPDKLDLLTSYGGFIGYTHYWNPKWSSNLIYSFVGLEKTDLVSAQDFKFSNYALGNLFYQPFDRLTFGVEYIWGNLYTQNDSTGDANRLQFLAQFNF